MNIHHLNDVVQANFDLMIGRTPVTQNSRITIPVAFGLGGTRELLFWHLPDLPYVLNGDHPLVCDYDGPHGSINHAVVPDSYAYSELTRWMGADFAREWFGEVTGLTASTGGRIANRLGAAMYLHEVALSNCVRRAIHRSPEYRFDQTGT